MSDRSPNPLPLDTLAEEVWEHAIESGEAGPMIQQWNRFFQNNDEMQTRFVQTARTALTAFLQQGIEHTQRQKEERQLKESEDLPLLKNT